MQPEGIIVVLVNCSNPAESLETIYLLEVIETYLHIYHLFGAENASGSHKNANLPLCALSKKATNEPSICEVHASIKVPHCAAALQTEMGLVP